MSDLVKAFAGMKDRPGTQAPKALASVAKFVQAGQRAQAAVNEIVGPRLAPPIESTAKNSDPDYRAVKVFLRKRTHKAAGRKWQDEGAGDFSDLVELLLQKYLNT